MSVVSPTIDDLLAVTDENRFLLCEIASRRARDINDMMRNQHGRVEHIVDPKEIADYLSDEKGHIPNPLSIAFEEICPKFDGEGNRIAYGDVTFDGSNLDAALGITTERPTFGAAKATDAPEGGDEAQDAPAGIDLDGMELVG